MENAQFWQKIASKRTSWKPATPAPNSETTKFPRTISRAISLRGLEMPVKQFLQEGLDREDINRISEDGILTLMRNQEDEDRHDSALNTCYEAFGNYNGNVTQDAQSIIDRWVELEAHPIVKAAVLENGVFFVVLPLFNLHGTTTLRETSQWISRDEILHVQSHRKASELLGARPTKALDNLRKETVDWIVSYLDEETGKVGSKDRWMKASDQLMRTGKSELNETKFAVKPAFFEIDNSTVNTYA